MKRITEDILDDLEDHWTGIEKSRNPEKAVMEHVERYISQARRATEDELLDFAAEWMDRE